MSVLIRRKTAFDKIRERASEVSEQALEAAEQVQEELADRVVELRRTLADRIDPDPTPRRFRRWLIVAVVVLAFGVAAGAFASWRARPSAPPQAGNGQHPSTENPSADNPSNAGGNGVSAETR